MKEKVDKDYIISVLVSKGYTVEKAQRLLDKLVVTGTLTSMLYDVVDNFLQDYRNLVREAGASIPADKEKCIKEMRKSYNHFHKNMITFTCPIFKRKSKLSENSEDLSYDLYEIVKLIADHTNSKEDMEQIKKSISKRKCNHKIFES